MSKKWLYLPIEERTRELDAKLLLAYYALKRKYNVVFGAQYDMVTKADKFPNGVFLSKGHTSNNFKFAYHVKSLGNKIVELDEEALFLTKDRYIGRRTDDKLLSSLDQLYCWGEHQKNLLLENYPIHKDKIFLTGHPRFDLLKKKFHNLYNEDISRIKKRFGDFILINTRFGLYNSLSGFNNNNLELKRLYESFIWMIKNLSVKFPSLNIIVRPHPAENIESYRTELKNYKNAFVIHEGSVTKWILASKLVIHNGCTTGIEAFIAERPVFSYMPFLSKKNDEYLPNELSIKVGDCNDLITKIKKFISLKEVENNSLSFNKRKELLSNYYKGMDGSFAYENIFNLMEKVSFDSKKEVDFIKKKSGEIFIKDIALKEEEVKRFFSLLDETEKCKSNINIYNYDRSMFVFENMDSN